MIDSNKTKLSIVGINRNWKRRGRGGPVRLLSGPPTSYFRYPTDYHANHSLVTLFHHLISLVMRYLYAFIGFIGFIGPDDINYMC